MAKAVKFVFTVLLYVNIIRAESFESSSESLDSDDNDDFFRESPECAAEFVNDQGSTSQFFIPVGDYVGFVDPDFTQFALIDYLGIADQWLMDNTFPQRSFDTEVSVSCFVTDAIDDDDTIRIRIEIETNNAMGFAINITSGEYIFGNNATAIQEDPDAATGLCAVDFIAEFPIIADSLRQNSFPDLVQLFAAQNVYCNKDEKLPYKFDFRAHCTENGNTLDVLQQGCEKKKGQSQRCDIATIDIQ